MSAGPESEGPRIVTLQEAAARLAGARRVVVTTHARADGDAIGSALAMRRVLAARGAACRAMFHEAIPSRYAFLPDVDRAEFWRAGSHGEVLATADLVLIVDTCAAAQLESIAASIGASGLPALAIDHHLTRDPIVDEILVDPTAGACTQIIARLCDDAGWSIDAATATLLFAGLATDTGWFRFSNADAAVFATGSRLVSAGAAPNALHERLYANEPAARLRLVGAALSAFELLAGGRLAATRVTREMLRRCGADATMTEDLINEPQRVGSVVASVLLTEPDGAGPVRVSFRSKHGVDVAQIARRFGGGGHARAAGAKIAASLDEAWEMVVPIMVEAVDRISGSAGDSA